MSDNEMAAQMLIASSMLTPDPIATKAFTDAFAAVARFPDQCKQHLAQPGADSLSATSLDRRYSVRLRIR